MDIFTQRYSCRGYSGAAPTKEQLEAIGLAALRAPSAMNRQPWLINVITDKAFLAEMDAEAMAMMAAMEDKEMYERFRARGGKIFYDAPCMFLILKQPGGDLDCGIVAENIALAATTLGLGNVICGMAGLPFTGDKGDEFKDRAGFVPGYEFGMSVLVGTAAGPGTAHEPDMAKLRFL